MKKLSFIDAISAWENAIKNKDKSKLDELLSDDFVWKNIAMEGEGSKVETIEWAINVSKEVPGFEIGDYKTIYEGEDILVGTHSVNQDDRDETIVVCIANISKDGRHITMWRHLRAEYPE